MASKRVLRKVRGKKQVVDGEVFDYQAMMFQIIAITVLTFLIVVLLNVLPRSVPDVDRVGSVFASVSVTPQPFKPSLAYNAKIFLYQLYRPNVCFGKPVEKTKEAIDEFLAVYSKEELEFVKSAVGGVSKEELYNRIQQLQAITVFDAGEGSFGYFVRSGECCFIITREGTLTFEQTGFVDSPRTMHTQSIPCN
ncbi:MAG: hypothetical protein ACE5DI_04490 [Candidatus Micrarchaeia archaeon]